MKRVYAEVTIKVVIHYKNPASLVDAVRSLEEGFKGHALASGEFEWDVLQKRPAVKVL